MDTIEAVFEGRGTLLNKVFLNCLYRDEEIVEGKVPEDAVIVNSIMGKYGFNPVRLAENKDQIRKLLTGLSPNFYKESGGGYTTLQMPFDANDEQWGEHRNVDQLCALAIATKMGEFCLPREMWAVLPGGMPYFTINLSGEVSDEKNCPVD